MYYSDSNNQSAEILRLVIPFLSRHGLPANPITYAVCYEYFAHSNKAIRKSIDALLNNGQEPTNEVMVALFDKYINLKGQADLSRISDEVKRIIHSLSSTAKSADSEAARYIESLHHHSVRLDGNHDGVSIENIVQRLLSDTRTMQAATLEMQTRLDDQTNEIGVLRTQLQQLREEILVDALTGLTNRKGLAREIEKALSKLQSAADSCCILMIDIDHFKTINDTYGHLIGDRVIRFIAETLKCQVKGKDTVSRFGGEEFVVLLPETSLSGARSAAENIRSAIAKTRIKRQDTGESIGQVTVSIGVARYLPGETGEQFLNRADAALYKSKRNGRNRVTADECDVIQMKASLG